MTENKLHEEHVELMEQKKDGRWMAVFYYVDEDDNKIKMLRTTSNFQRGDFPECVQMLKQHCIDELFGDTNVEPSPLKRFRLMGDSENGENN